MNVGERIKECRMALGWSQRELSDKMGYSNHSTITRVENGQVDLPQSKLVKFADVLGTTTAHLMGWDKESEELADIFSGVMSNPGALRLMKTYMSLDDAGKKKVDTILEALAK